MSRNKKRVKSAACPNCHTVFAETHTNYCAHCGQENHTHKLPVKHFVMELIEAFTHFDTKFLATFKDLVLHPGLVIQKFNANKRARYVPPIRIYVFTSFAFFLILALSVNKKVEKAAVKITHTIQGESAGQISLMNKTQLTARINEDLKALPNLSNAAIDSVLRAEKVKTDWINTRILNSVIKLEKGELTIADLYKKFIKSSSYAIFILMPLFALLLMLFYRKRNYFYSEFLVFSIYYHTFVFGVFGILMTLNGLFDVDMDYIFSFLAFSMFLYLGMALKRVFADSMLKTAIKAVLLSGIYLMLLLFSILILVLNSLV
ncbi:MAG: hypothetical protein RL757_2717 [Bacteroidota bacterium]|jgi:hypothetical protein